MPEYIHEEEALGKAYDSKLIKRLIKYLRSYKFQTICSLVFLLIWIGLRIVSPLLMKIAVDAHIKTGNIVGLSITMAILFGVICIESLARYYQIFTMAQVGQQLMKDIRKEIYAKFQSLQMSFFDKNPVGRLMTRVTSDVDAINEFLTNGTITIIADVFLVVASTAILFILDYRLALIALSIMPLMGALGIIFKNLAVKFYRDARVKNAKVNAFLQESISGVRTIQWSGRTEINKGMFNKIARELLGAQLRNVINYSVFFMGIDFFESIAMGFIIWFGARLVLGSFISVGLLLAFTQYVREFYMSMYDISEHFNTMQDAMTSSERIFKLIDEDVTIVDRPGSITPSNPVMGEVEFQNVQFAYNPNEPVLNGISFKVKPGQKVAIVGPTGAGKSSIISLLSRLYEIQGGDIKIDGVSIYNYTLPYLRRQISVVLQDPFIFSGPVIDNITLLTDIQRDKAYQASKLVGSDDFIMRLPDNYNTKLTERGATLSVGQRQLLSFARAIAHDPRILVLDEATSSIDTESEMLIQSAVKKMMVGRTSIVVAHRLSTIKDADQVLVIQGGQIVESGSHEELIAQDGVYRKLYELQFQSQEVIGSNNL